MYWEKKKKRMYREKKVVKSGNAKYFRTEICLFMINGVRVDAYSLSKIIKMVYNLGKRGGRKSYSMNSIQNVTKKKTYGAEGPKVLHLSCHNQ
jgi:hypothetical protein